MSQRSTLITLFTILSAIPMAAQEYKIAFIGMRHYISWTYMTRILAGQGGPVKLVGIAETEPGLIAESKRRGATNIPFYSDYNKMLDETKPDIVWGFLENNRRLEVIQACAPRKIHVIYQKPLATNLKDALAIQALAKKHGIHVLTNYDLAYYTTTHATKAKADSGAIGKVWRLHGIDGHGGPSSGGPNRFFYNWLIDPAQNGGGALADFAGYSALWAYWYKGRPETVYATVNHLRPEEFPKSEDNSVLVLTYKDGVAILEGSWDLPRGYQQLEVFGRTGSLLSNGSTDVTMQIGKQPPVKIDLPALPPEMFGTTNYLAYCLKNKKPIEGLASLDFHVGVTEIMEAAKRSVQSGKAISLPIKIK